LYIKEGQYAEAVEFAQKALSLDPKMSPSLSAMTIASYMLGDMEAYENYYRQAVAAGRNGDALKNYIRSLDPTI
jgi:Tfp pilus assembly protein PilF